VVQRAAASIGSLAVLTEEEDKVLKEKQPPGKITTYIELQALRKRFVTSRELKNDLRWLRLDTRKEISTKTVRRMLKEVNLVARKPAAGPIFTTLHKRNRLSFFLNHQLWNERHWDSVLFTNESRFTFPITIVVFSFCKDLVRGTMPAKKFWPSLSVNSKKKV
jgi:hypothetical protein